MKAGGFRIPSPALPGAGSKGLPHSHAKLSAFAASGWLAPLLNGNYVHVADPSSKEESRQCPNLECGGIAKRRHRFRLARAQLNGVVVRFTQRLIMRNTPSRHWSSSASRIRTLRESPKSPAAPRAAIIRLLPSIRLARGGFSNSNWGSCDCKSRGAPGVVRPRKGCVFVLRAGMQEHERHALPSCGSGQSAGRRRTARP